MRRLSLSTKLFAAALPLVLAVGGLLALTVRNDLRTVDDAERGADLAVNWEPLVQALVSVETELGDIDASSVELAAPEQVTVMTEHRRATDRALNTVSDAIKDLGAAEAARKHITQSRSALSGARRSIDMGIIDPGTSNEIDPIVAYDSALRELVSIGQLLPAEAGDPDLGRELLAVVKLAEGRVAADAVIANVEAWQQDPLDPAPLATARVRLVEIEAVFNEFTAIAPEEWVTQYRQSGFSLSLAQYRAELDSARRAAERAEVGTFDVAGFAALSNESLALQQEITASIASRASDQAAQTRQNTLIALGIALIAVLLASMIAWLLTRSVTRRVRAVSRSANQVATEQLPALVEALHDPRGKTVLPAIEPVNTRGNDELAELAHAFNSMQSTLVDVAHEQVEVLRRGVSDIFVTMARRNRSLIDRQLAMLDEFEAEVDDPDVLSHYYQLDHMATRMRRNSESLLVLANAEPKRRRVKATEIDDVVRAAIGEVEDYRRIEVEALESLQVRGNVVADVSHLLAELLDNATSFSPPDSIVRVGGRRAGDSYMLRIVDNGVGIGVDRLRELNELLREPPIVGLSVEPTLGMSVVSLLANRHSVMVTLSQGSPGTTVDVLLPSSLFGPIDVPVLPNASGLELVDVEPIAEPGVDETSQIVRWDIPTDVAAEQFERFERADEAEPETFPDVTSPEVPLLAPVAERAPLVSMPMPVFDAPEPVVPSWTNMSLDLDSLRATPSQPDLASPEPGPELEPQPVDEFVADEPIGSTPDAEPELIAVDEIDPELLPTDEVQIEQAEAEQADVEPADTDVDISLDIDGKQDLDEPEPEPSTGFEVAALSVDIDTDPTPAHGHPSVSLADDLLPPTLPSRMPAPALPPPSLAPVAAPAPVGEFERPLQPPFSADGPSTRPVTPADARPLPARNLPEPSLPTRSPSRGPDGGPDRIAAMGAPPSINQDPSVPSGAGSSPSALQSALAAFDSRRNGASELPTRGMTGEHGAAPAFDDSASTTQSRLDPEALRERLRAFQNEFRIATDGAQNAETDTEINEHETPTLAPSNADLGGDRR